MRIQHNILAMNAYRNYTNNTSALGKNLEKLSSGYKINRAGDDAAGLAISEKMRAQITGLNAASKNVKDGISLVKTAEGAMQEIQDMLNRMDYLATQSANGTYQDEVDRENLNKEMEALKTEIDRIAESANFNGIKLLNGDLETKAEKIADAAVNTNYIVDESLDGIEPTKAQTAKYEVTLPGLDKTQAATVTGVKANNVTVNAAGADAKGSYQSEAIKNDTAGGAIKVTINYKTADGTDASKTIDVTAADTDAATTAGSIKTAIEGDDDLKDLFDVTVNNTSALKIDAKEAGSGNAYVTGITVAENGGTTGITIANGNAGATAAAGVDKDSYDLSKFGQNAADTITVNGKEYKQANYNNFAALKTALEADGLEVTGNADGTNVKIMGANPTGTSKIGGLGITWGTTDIAALGEKQIDGKKVSEQFNVKIDGVAVDFADATATAAKLKAGSTISFEAKIPGEVSQNVKDAFNGTNTSGTVAVTEGINEDKAAAASKAKYELTVNLDNLAGNQRVKIGDTTYEISTSGTLVDANNTLINLKGLDPKTDAGKEAIKTELAKIQPAGYTTTAAVNGSSVKLSIEANATGSASNLGNIQVYDNPAAVTGSYTAGKDEAVKDKARPTSVVYNVDLSKLAVGDTLKIGDKEIKVVADDKADPATGALKLADAKDGAKLAGALYGLGYQHNVSFDTTNNKMTITYAQQTGGGGTTSDTTAKTAAQFAAGDAKVTFTSNTPTTRTVGSPLKLQIGDTSDTFNQMEVSVGDMHASAMYALKRDENGDLLRDSDGNTIKDESVSIRSIDIKTQDNAAAAVNVIKDAINYVSGIRGDLGAIQNRLEHTQNNLSVMAENIQDAESTIRDTDVAEEMMSYVKNNILVQSAQAMLAQANQVPQGVLQLLG